MPLICVMTMPSVSKVSPSRENLKDYEGSPDALNL
jgi:hypothetical protein